MLSARCQVRVLPSLQVYEGLILASWLIGEKEVLTARRMLLESHYIVHQALKAELIKEKVAQRITTGIDVTITALEAQDYQKAEESVLDSLTSLINHALEEAVQCESDKITEGLV